MDPRSSGCADLSQFVHTVSERQLRRSKSIRVIRAIRGRTLVSRLRECATPDIPTAIGALEVRPTDFIRPPFPGIRS